MLLYFIIYYMLFKINSIGIILPIFVNIYKIKYNIYCLSFLTNYYSHFVINFKFFILSNIISYISSVFQTFLKINIHIKYNKV